MRTGTICALVLATASSALAESRPPPPPNQGAPQTAPAAPPRAPRKARAPVPPDNEPHRQLTACFTSAAQHITMILVVAYDGTKLRSSVKQSAGATKQIEACVVDVFDHLAVRFPRRPVTIELPVEYTPVPVGA